MEQTKKKIAWLVAFLAVGSIDVFGKPFAVGSYLGQVSPGPIAQVFAPGLICDTRPYQWESHGHFSADGNTFCFYRHWYVYITENTDQGWTVPKRIKSIPYHSYSCCLSADANSIYVKCSPFNRSKRRIFPKPKSWCLRYCMRTSQGWSSPQELGPPFSDSGGGFSVSADNSICFKSRGGFWVAPFVGNTWSQAIKIPVEMGNLRGCCPGIAPDESFLVFYSIKPGAQGGTETNLYLTLREADGTWTKPRNMGPVINTGYYEYGARISPDKKYMFFTRSIGWDLGTLCDTADIYWVELKEYLPESHR
ncbi:MAG: PD40 domain-containing protein [Planctomycetes bacterium]|nr:PD40 domain-containing protein [Planctomycetota bacterium]